MKTARFRAFLCAMIAFWGLQLSAFGADAVSAPAAPPPHKVVVPVGFHVLSVGDRNVLCQPSDDAWVTAAMGTIKPATRPSTMPSDILSSIKAKRDILVKTIMSDFALTDQKPVDDVLDNTIISTLQKMLALKPPIYYFVVSRKQLAGLMDKGWEDPHYHYIRFSGDVEFSGDIALSIDQPMDDMVLWVETHDDETVQAKSQSLASAAGDFDQRLLVSLSTLSQQGTMRSFADFIKQKVMDPLKLPPAEDWFGGSVAEVYAIKYTTSLTGGSRKEILNALFNGNPRNPIQPGTLNLVSPLDPTQMLRQNIPFYEDAVIRKGSFIIDQWMKAGGEDVVAKSLPALRLFPPNGPQDLIKVIKDSTGVDITPVMQPTGH